MTLKDILISGKLTISEGGGGSLPRLLNHVEYNVEADITKQNPQTIQLSVPDNQRYVVFLTAREMPDNPPSGEYTAMTWASYWTGAGANTTGTIKRSDGTMGNDNSMATFNNSTGVLTLSPPYATYRVGQTFDIYLFQFV